MGKATVVRERITRRGFMFGVTALGAGALAAACGQAAPAMEEQEMAPEQKEEAKAEAEAPSGPQGEALYWHRGFFDFEPWAKEFAEMNPGLTLNAVGEADRLNKFKTAVAAGSPPDAVDVGDWQTVELGVTEISQPLNNYYKASGALDLSEFWPSVLSYLTDAPTGNMYGAPYAPGPARDVHPRGYVSGGGSGPGRTRRVRGPTLIRPSFRLPSSTAKPWCAPGARPSGAAAAPACGCSCSGSWAAT